MNFDLFVNKLHSVQQASLPAIESHLKMAPVDPHKMREMWDYSGLSPRQAGVLALFYPKNNEAHFALIVRTSRGVHATQVAFPGGQQEEADINLVHTAVRETEEEIGIPREHIHVIKDLSEIYVQPSNFLVHPCVGYIDYEPMFIPQVDEVSEIIEVPLGDFMVLETTRQLITASYYTFSDVPVFKVQGHLVWGATAMILSELRDVFIESM